jgi:trigger factor
VKSAVESLSPTRIKLTVEVPFEELRPSVDAAYKKIARQVAVPGFRRGKVPPPVIDQRVGREAVLDEAVNDALPQFYLQALEENDVQPLSQPAVDVTGFADGQELAFSAELDVRPAIELPEYTGVEVSVPDATPSDDDIEEQVQALRERFATLTTVERAAQDGDFVTIDLAASKDGAAIEEAQATGMSYKVGSGTMLDGLDESLLGLEAGGSATFASTLAGGDLAGQPVDVEVRVHAVKEQDLPELDDDFAQSASEFDTVEELRADLRTRLERGKRLEQAAAARDAVLEALLAKMEVPLPEGAVDEEVTARRESIRQQLTYAGMTEAKYLESEGQSEEDFATEMESRVRASLAAQFVLDEIAKKEELSVAEQELTEHLVRRATQAGVQPQDFVQQVVQSGQVPALVAEVVRGKALALVVEAAKVTDESGSPVELKNLQPDGSIAEPGDDAQAVEGGEAEPS